MEVQASGSRKHGELVLSFLLLSLCGESYNIITRAHSIQILVWLAKPLAMEKGGAVLLCLFSAVWFGLQELRSNSSCWKRRR